MQFSVLARLGVYLLHEDDLSRNFYSCAQGAHMFITDLCMSRFFILVI
jgi:hypothetical protein